MSWVHFSLRVELEIKSDDKNENKKQARTYFSEVSFSLEGLYTPPTQKADRPGGK